MFLWVSALEIILDEAMYSVQSRKEKVIPMMPTFDAL